MKKTPFWPPNDALVGYFSKHLVPVYFTFEKGETTHSGYMSAFLISMDDKWFLITAGHCMEEIENNIKKGYEIKRCRLIDSGGLVAHHINPIPFDYLSAPKIHVDVAGFDYGAIYINDYYKSLLVKNNVKPLSEHVWEKQPDDPDFYLLLGIPRELTEVNDEYFSIGTTLHHIKALDQRLSDFPDTKAPMFYGEIQLDNTLTNIKGMSGGPIFSFKKNEKGELKYWLHAVQSHWLPNKKYIAACLTSPFLMSLKEVITKIASEVG
jgi:hypothetical protein